MSQERMRLIATHWLANPAVGLQFKQKQRRASPNPLLFYYYYYYYFSDLPGYLSPSILTGDTFRPDLLLLLPLNCLYVLELTVGYEPNFYSNAIRKEKKYQQLMLELRSQYKEVHFVNLSMGALGVMNNSSTSFLDMMKDLGFDENTRSFIIRRLMAISIRATYFIFYRRNNDWPNPDHLTF